MGPKLNVKGGGKKDKEKSRGQVVVVVVLDGAILVHELLLDEDYNRYLQKFHSRFLANQFYCDVSDIGSMGFGFHELLDFQKLNRIVSFKDTFDENQVKEFHCNAKRQDDGMSLLCLFKNVVAS